MYKSKQRLESIEKHNGRLIGCQLLGLIHEHGDNPSKILENLTVFIVWFDEMENALKFYGDEEYDSKFYTAPNGFVFEDCLVSGEPVLESSTVSTHGLFMEFVDGEPVIDSLGDKKWLMERLMKVGPDEYCLLYNDKDIPYASCLSSLSRPTFGASVSWNEQAVIDAITSYRDLDEIFKLFKLVVTENREGITKEHILPKYFWHGTTFENGKCVEIDNFVFDSFLVGFDADEEGTIVSYDIEPNTENHAEIELLKKHNVPKGSSLSIITRHVGGKLMEVTIVMK